MAMSLNPEIPHQREQLRRLFLIKRTEVEMMHQRGFNVTNVYVYSSGSNSYVTVNFSDFLNPTLGMDKYQQSPFFTEMLQRRAQTGLFQTRQEFTSIYYTEDMTRPLAVIYLDNDPGKQVSKKYFNVVNNFIQAKAYHEMILVTTTGLNSDLNTLVRSRSPAYKIEVFLDSELAYNRIQHAYAPIDIKYVPSKEINEWGRQEGIQPQKLPMMLDTDIIAKWFGATPMDIFQMELLGTTTDTVGYNRIVRMTPAKT